MGIWGSRGTLCGDETAQQRVPVKRRPSAILPEAVRKILGPFHHYAQPAQIVDVQPPCPPGGRMRRAETTPTPGTPQQRFIVRCIDLHGKSPVGQGPAALGVHPGIKVRMGRVQQLLRPEPVKPQQPVRLIEPVLPQGGGFTSRAGSSACSTTGT